VGGPAAELGGIGIGAQLDEAIETAFRYLVSEYLGR
jgi:hypothetical protein